jgi:hypothetical protein
MGGSLDVLVLVQGDPGNVRSVMPSLDAVRSDVGMLTIACAVDYEWIEGDLDNDVVASSGAALRRSRELGSVEGAALALHPGTPETVAARFRARSRRTLVLFAIEPSPAESVTDDRG